MGGGKADIPGGGGGGARDSAGILSAIIETIPGAVITINREGVVLSFSAGAARMFGYAPDEIIGRKVDELMPSPYREGHDQYLARYHRTGERRIIGIGRIVVAQRKDGSTFPVELSVGEYKAGGQRGYVGHIRDITDSAQAERQIHQLQTNLLQATRASAMGEMSSGLAHELNQPISAIMSYIDAALHLLDQGGGKEAERLREMLGKAAAQSRRAGQIVHHLRRFVMTGETEKAEEDLNMVIQDALAMALIGGAGKGPAVRLELGANLPRALLDRVQIQQVVINLLKNGIEALSGVAHGAICVGSRRHDETFLEVTVRDNGPGIDSEIVDRLFHPFVTTKARGMGIGLSLCRSIIESHGGRIWVSPEARGGTRFTFTVPAVDDSKDEPIA